MRLKNLKKYRFFSINFILRIDVFHILQFNAKGCEEGERDWTET